VRPLGLRSYGVQAVECKGAIRNAVIKKAKKYGKLTLPYAIGVNVLDDFADDIDVTQALFGTEQFVVPIGTGGVTGEPEMRRLPDGVWYGRSGPRYTRVSAVLIVSRLRHWGIWQADVRLYHNPWAQRPCRCELRQLPQALPQDGKMVLADGKPLGEVLGLPPDWPDV